MRLVLAVEADPKQADALRRVLDQQNGIELIVVLSSYAAISFMKRRVPDLVLLGASLGRKSQEVVDIFCLVSTAPNPQTLPIPPGEWADPEEFAAQVAACLARAEEQRHQHVQRDAQEVEQDSAANPQPVPQAPFKDESVLINLHSLSADDGRIDPQLHEARVALLQARAEARLASELERVRREAEEQRAAAEQAAHETLAREVARVSAESEARLAAEDAAVRALEAEVARVRQESEARLAAALAHAHAEAEAARWAQQQAQIDLDASREAAMRQARDEAEQAAARALDAEVERVRAEAEVRLEQEFARVRADADACVRTQLALAGEEAERARLARESELEEVRRRVELEAEARAGAMLEAEVARARADAEARLAAEVALVHAEAERRRAADFAQMRAQLADVHESAREHAGVAAQVGSHTEGAVRTAGVVLRESVRYGRIAVPLMRTAWQRLPARTVPAAAMVLLLVGAAMIVDVTSLTNAATSWARSASATAPTARSSVSRTVRGRPEPLQSAAATAPQRDLRPEVSEKSEAMAEPSGSGFLAVFSRVPLDLYLGGRRIGTTEDGQILLPSGRYRVTLVNTRLKYQGEVTLDVRPTAVTAHTVVLPAGSLQVNAEPGAGVWIEGKHAGVAPLGILSVPIGTREIVVRHPALGERREYVEVRYGEVAEVSINLGERIDPRPAFPLPSLADPAPQIRGY
jgi:hypothetical protein